MKNKFKPKDRVVVMTQGYIYIVDDFIYDPEICEYVYMVHGLDSDSVVKYFPESKLSFAGFSCF